MKHSASPILRSLTSAFLLASFLLPPLAGAATALAPVDYPDATHVPNGCYLSAITYLRNFSAEHPDEQTRILGFAPRGWGGGHFIALVTWRGEWWIRDEYFGLFAIGQKVGPTLNPAKLDQKAANVFDRYTMASRKAGQMPILPWLIGKLTEVQKADSVAAAATLLPFKTEQFRVQSGAKELTFLFFRPVAGRIAVYEPSHGTAVAVCAGSDAAEIVAVVATKFGYKVTSVRSTMLVATTLVAAN